MTDEQIKQWQQQWDSYVTRLAPLFARSEPREQATKYLRSRFRYWNVRAAGNEASQLDDASPARMQRLLLGIYGAPELRPLILTFAGYTGAGITTSCRIFNGVVVKAASSLHATS